MKYIKRFKDTKAYQSYINSTKIAIPNISLEKNVNKVNISKNEDRIIVKYENTSTGNLSLIMSTLQNPSEIIKSIEFDGEVLSEGVYTVTLNEPGKHIVKYELKNPLVLPQFLSGLPITEVYIPNNIKTIKQNAFAGTKLTNLDIPNTVTSIESGIVSSTPIKKIIIGRGIKTIPLGCFSGLSNLEEIKLSNQLETIESGAFAGCSKIKSIKIPNSVKTIGSAFSGLISLETLIIGDGVKTLTSGLISGCSSLKYVKIGKKITELPGGLFNGSNTSLKKLIIPENVKTIKSGAFSGCPLKELILKGVETIEAGGLTLPNIKNLKLPKTLKNFTGTSIPSASNLENITIDNDNQYFYSSDNMIFSKDNTTLLLALKKTSISLNNNITKLGEDVFNLSPNIKRINSDTDGVFNLPNVDTIGTYAFYNNTQINNLIISSSITNISAYAFKNCNNLKRINSDTDGVFNLPNVDTIGTYAFCNNTQINNLIISSSITNISAYAFQNCNNLKYINSDTIGTFNLPNVETVGSYAFYGCTGLTSTTIGNYLTSIGEHGFSGCMGLTSITLSNSLTSIGSNAFNSCTKITSLNIPSSVTSIGNYAFFNCQKLESITVDSNNTKYDSRNDCNALIETASNKLLLGCKNTIIPNTITSLYNYAFYKCYGLYSIIIPDSVTSIGTYVFQYCDKITEITIPNTVTSIGNYAFQYCSGLKSVEISNSITSLGDYVFNNCGNLTSVTIPNTVTSIGKYTFAGTGLKSIDIPNSVTSINQYAFSTCSYLKIINLNRITPPTIYSNSFSTVSGRIINIPSEDYLTAANWSTWASYMALPLPSTTPNNVIYYKSSEKLSETTNQYTYGLHTNQFNATIESHEYNSKIGKITFSGNVTSLKNYAFYGCSQMINITLPDTVVTIGNNAFQGSGLTSIIISDYVTSIGSTVFSRCTALESISVSSNNQTYDSRSNCNAIIETATNTLLSGCKNTIIPNNVTSLYSRAFEGCTGLTSITIPDSVTSLGSEYTFSGCTALTSIIIPDSVTDLGSMTFTQCSKITSFTIPSSVTKIRYGLFYECTGLTSIIIPSSITEINNDAFYRCSNLESVTINSNIITYMGSSVFESCRKLKSIVIPDCVPYIAFDMFKNCTSLTSVTLGNALTNINSNVFYGCTALASITINTVTPPTLGNVNVFTNTPSTKKIYVPAESVEAYKSASNWSTYASCIVAIPTT